MTQRTNPQSALSLTACIGLLLGSQVGCGGKQGGSDSCRFYQMSNTEGGSREELELQAASVLVICESGEFSRYLLGKKRSPGKWVLGYDKKTLKVTQDVGAETTKYSVTLSGDQIVKLTLDSGLEFRLIAVGKLADLENLDLDSSVKEDGR